MNVAFIPIRGGSKSITLKNIKEIGGMPLCYWTILAASKCKYIDKIYVATDSDIIKRTVENFNISKVNVINRSPETATDTASTEMAMLEFAYKYEFDNICLIQATSPLLEKSDLDSGFELFNLPNVDSVLSAVKQKRFNWLIDKNGNANAINYNYKKRPRRQEFDGYYVENGAFYITSKESLLFSKNRISGNIKICEMSEDNYYEIDEPSDWLIIENILQAKRSKKNSKKIKMFLTDSDGCLTDGGMYYTENGDEIKKFNARDGYGFKKLKDCGIITGIVTGEKVSLIKRRGEKLNLDIIECGVCNKKEKIIELSKKYNINLEQIAYIGDDLFDVDALKICGFSACPNDAFDDVKKICKYVSLKNGGAGAVREIIDYLLNI